MPQDGKLYLYTDEGKLIDSWNSGEFVQGFANALTHKQSVLVADGWECHYELLPGKQRIHSSPYKRAEAREESDDEYLRELKLLKQPAFHAYEIDADT